MFRAARLAVRDLLSPALRGILVRSILLTLVLFAALLVGAVYLFDWMALVSTAWVARLLEALLAIGMVLAFVFLMAPVTALFAGFSLDTVAHWVEVHDYPADPPGRALPFFTSLRMAAGFALVMIMLNLLALPTLFLGVGPLIILVVNAYLVSREYFEMAAARHMTPAAARSLRRRFRLRVFASGFLPAALSLVPFLNMVVPIFSTAYFTHIFRQVAVFAAGTGRGLK